MPSKNEVKQYIEEGYYHIYNRGVEKRPIFLDNQDYTVFLFYMKQALIKKDENKLRKQLSLPSLTVKERESILRLLRLKNFYNSFFLLAYCLMKNHFHLLIQQKKASTMTSLMNSFLTRYSMYFNKKYKRVGPLYQGVYKAVLVNSDAQLLELSRYIHRNPFKKGIMLQDYPFSSCSEYLGRRNTSWIQHQPILSFFSQTNPSLSYESFINQSEDYELISKLIIEDSN